MRLGLFISCVFHAAIIGAAYLSLPFLEWRPDVTAEPFVPVELIRDAELDLTTSVPAAAPEPVEELDLAPDLPEPDLPEPELVEALPAPLEKIIPEPEPEPAPTETEPERLPEPEKEPEPVKKPEPKNDDLDLDALSALIDKEKENPQKTPQTAPSETTEEAESARPAIGAGDRLTASSEAKMRAAVEPCWNANAIIGAPNPEKLVVTVDFELNRDGTLASPPRVANGLQINLSGNRFWKVAEQQALRAVTACAPYDFLPAEQYQTWKEFKLNFDPSQMAGF